MSRGLNKVQLIGRVGGDPDCRQMPNGNAVANLTLATGESWKDKNTGQRMERTEWHRVVFFGRLAEIVQQYVRKGSLIYVEGRLQTREWEKDGVKRYTTEIVIDMGGQMQMLDSRNQGQSQGQNQGYQQAPQPQQHNQGQYNQAPPQHQTGSHSYAQATGGGNYHAPAPQRQQPPPQPQAAPNQPQRSSNGNAPGYNPYNANSGQPQQTRQHQPAPVAQVPPNYDGSLAEDEEIPF